MDKALNELSVLFENEEIESMISDAMFWTAWWTFVILLGVFYFGLAVHEALTEKKSISKTLVEYLLRVINA